MILNVQHAKWHNDIHPTDADLSVCALAGVASHESRHVRQYLPSNTITKHQSGNLMLSEPWQYTGNKPSQTSILTSHIYGSDFVI